MPRPARIHLEGALYYVTSRGEPEAPLFRDDQDVRAYLDLLSLYKAQYGFKLYAYTLSSDQAQLCLEVASGTTISQIMHALNSRYTKIYGKRYHRSGHLFQGRYRATVLEREPALAPLTRYLHAQTDALATSLPQYQRSDSSWLNREEVFCRFTQADPREKTAGEEARKGYGIYVQSAVPEELEEWRRMLEQPVIGSPDFLRAVEQAKAEAQGGDADSYPEQEPLLVPVRRGGGPWRKLISIAAILGLLYSVGSVAVLSGIVVKQAGSAKRVEVVLQAAHSASSLNLSEPAPRLAAVMPEAPLQINGTHWEIQIKPMVAANGRTVLQADRLRFEGGRVTSSELASEGFSGSNYTLTPQPDGTFLWETMQSGPAGETVCWRGECDGERMRGVMTRQKPGRGMESFNFIGLPAGESGVSEVKI